MTWLDKRDAARSVRVTGAAYPALRGVDTRALIPRLQALSRSEARLAAAIDACGGAGLGLAHQVRRPGIVHSHPREDAFDLPQQDATEFQVRGPAGPRTNQEPRS